MEFTPSKEKVKNLRRKKDGAYAINHEKTSDWTHWVSLFIDRITTVYSVSFKYEYITQEVLKKIKDKSITHNI